MLRPQRNGSGIKGYIRSNSYSVPLIHAKEMAKPTKDRSSLISEGSQLNVKTLKKPLNNYVNIETDKLADFGKPVISISLENREDFRNRVTDFEEIDAVKTQNNFNSFKNKTHEVFQKREGDDGDSHIVIRMDKDIKPANLNKQTKGKEIERIKINNFMNQLDDENSIISAYLKTNNKQLPVISLIQEREEEKQKQKYVNENKFKNLINSTANKQTQNKMKIKPERVTFEAKIEKEIENNIDEQIEEEDYLKEQFESIRESINNSGSKSNSHIKQSIKESIKESIQQSIKGDNNYSIRQSIKSVKESHNKSKFSNSIPELIYSKDKPLESNNIIQESIEVYEDDFQDEQSKQETHRQSKLKSEQSISKSFRKKKSPIIDVNLRRSKQLEESASFNKPNKDVFDKLKLEVKQLMGKSKKINDGWNKRDSGSYSTESINSLYNKFKHELGRFMEKGRLQEKAKKLVSFLPQTHSHNATQQMMTRVLEAINDFKQSNINATSLNKQNNYLDKIQEMMDNQQRRIRYDLQRNLKQKDEQIEKLLQRLQGMSEAKSSTNHRGKILEVLRKSNPMQNYFASETQTNTYADYKLEDYSQQYSEVSWESQIDLWDNITEEEKRKIFDKNSEEVMNHLVGLMMKQIKQEAIERSVDISFEFPAEIEAMVETSKRFEDETVTVKSFVSKTNNVLNDLSIISEHKTSERSFSSKSSKSEKQEEQYEIQPMNLLPNRVVSDKVEKTIIKYERKIKPKANKLFKQVYDFIKNPQSTAMRLVTQIRILEESEIETKQLEYVRAYEEHILTQVVGFLTNHAGDFKRLQQMFKDRFENMLSVAKMDYIKSVEVAIASKKKDSMPRNFNEILNTYTYKRLEGQEPFKEILCQFQDKAEVNKNKRKIEEQILNLLVEEMAKEIKLRKK